jgi:hypothetical protein
VATPAEPPKEPEVTENTTGAEDVNEGAGNSVIPEMPLYEWTEEEKGLLSIDTDKIVFYLGFYPIEEPMDDLSALKDKYPDLKFLRLERAGDSHRREIWHSDSTGLSYEVYHWKSESDGEWSNWMQRITGRADNLITGLVVPIKVEELMEVPGMSDAEWAIGEGPESNKFDGYYESGQFRSRFSPDENDVCILISLHLLPDRNEQAIGIRIKASNPGFISPDDEIEIVDVGIGV